MPDFLFVNKNQTSSHLTRGESSEATAIQHFVQKGRKRAQKGKLISGFKACPLQVEQMMEPMRNDPDKKASKISRRPRNDAHYAGTHAFYDVRSDNEVCIAPFRSSEPALYHNVSSGADPFQVMAIPIDTSIRSLINYYTTIYHPTLWPNESLALRRGGYIFEDAVNHVVQAGLHDSLAMYCLLTASISRLRHIDRLPLSEMTSSKEHHYMTQALHLMQQRIDQAAQYSGTNLLYLLTSMIFLAAAEAYRDDPWTSKTHLKACVRLLSHHNMSVMDIANSNLQGQFLMSDLFLGCINLEQCLFSADDFDPGPVYVLDLLPSELDSVAQDLELMAESLFASSLISPEIKLLVAQIKETYTTKSRLNTTTMTSTRAIQTTHWITKRNMAIRNRLLSCFPHRQSEGDSMLAELMKAPAAELLNKALRIVLIQFTLLSMNITGRIKTVKVMSRHLQRFLAPLTKKGDVANEKVELLLWLVVIGYSCAQDGTENEEWFAERLRNLSNVYEKLQRYSSNDGVEMYDDEHRLRRLEQLQLRYFYHEEVQRSRLTKLINGTWARSPDKLGDATVMTIVVKEVGESDVPTDGRAGQL